MSMSNQDNPRFLPPDDPDAPKFWMHETSGVLAPAVKAYLNADRLDRTQVEILKAYLWQWIAAPVWAPSGTLEALRLRVAAIATEQDIDAAIKCAVALGLDPL